ncbi:MAG: diaminopimelate epimerase [Gammaproteobacteria bacterium]|nr:diaminopimelate epimerase [Pseudomonadota bacterium]MCH9663034.1 diaminopimelate epimerase [Gammaproteobacteria bacterium]
MEFSKYHVAGNDIAVIDARDHPVPHQADFYRLIGDRRRGVGFDQAMIVLKPDALEPFILAASAGDPGRLLPVSGGDQPGNIDAAYVVYNADGSLSAQCGNGLCAMAHSVSLTDGKKSHLWRGLNRLVKTQRGPGGRVVADMGVPEFDAGALPYTGLHENGFGRLQTSNGLQLKFYLAGIGNPHAVIFLAEDQKDVLEQLTLIGQGLDSSDSFPEGVNVSLVYPEKRTHALIRVYERGVGPTLSCGSASCAAMACARRWLGAGEKLTLSHPGGSINVQWDGGSRPIFLHADVCRVYSAELDEGTYEQVAAPPSATLH